jgi:hypothetical protein
VSAGDVTTAVLAESGRVSVSAVRFFISGLRSFLRFCFAEGLAPAGLSPAVLAMTGRRGTTRAGSARRTPRRCWAAATGRRRSGAAITPS